MVYRLLESVGVRGIMTRPPREDRTSSCAYAVRIRPEELEAAQAQLDGTDFAPCKIRVVPAPGEKSI